jgi:hypothetical protein
MVQAVRLVWVLPYNCRKDKASGFGISEGLSVLLLFLFDQSYEIHPHALPMHDLGESSSSKNCRTIASLSKTLSRGHN